MRPTLSLQPMLSSSRRSSCALLLCLIGAATTHAQAPAPRTAADTISAARLAQNAMLRIGDLDSAATFWTEDIVVLAGLGARLDGREALRAAFARDGDLLFQRTPEQVEVSRGWPLAWERGRWVGVSRRDTSAVLITGWYSARWLHEGARWRIQSEQFVANDCRAAACRWPLASRSPTP